MGSSYIAAPSFFVSVALCTRLAPLSRSSQAFDFATFAARVVLELIIRQQGFFPVSCTSVVADGVLDGPNASGVPGRDEEDMSPTHRPVHAATASPTSGPTGQGFEVLIVVAISSAVDRPNIGSSHGPYASVGI